MILGEFEAAEREATAEQERDQFKFFDETFTLAGRPSLVPLIRLTKAMKGQGGEEERGVDMTFALARMIEDVLIPEDHDRFWDLAERKRVNDEELMKLLRWLYEVISARPTESRSDSVEARSTTSPSSSRSSSRRAELGLVPVEELLTG